MYNFVRINNPRMYVYLIIIFLECSMHVRGNPLSELSSREDLVQMAGYGEERLSTVIVTGTVVCQACLKGAAKLRSRPVSGAVVGVKCYTNDMKSKQSWAKSVTDEYGDFIIDLPSHLHSFPGLEKRCRVRILRVGKKSVCRTGFIRKQKRIKLSSFGNGIRAYTAGDLKLLHLTSKPSKTCFNNKNAYER